MKAEAVDRGSETVIDPATEAVLQEVVRRESRSLLSYIGDAYPWTTAEASRELGALGKLVREEGSAVAALGQYLVRKGGEPPFLGSYPAAFTSCNFISLGYLVPRLVETQRRSIAELEADVGKVPDPPSCQQLERLLAVKKKTLAGLEALAASPAEAAPTAPEPWPS